MGADQVYFCKFNSEKSSSLDAGTECTRGKIFYYTNYRKLKNYFFEKDFKIPFFSFKKTNRPNENSKIKYFQNFFWSGHREHFLKIIVSLCLLLKRSKKIFSPGAGFQKTFVFAHFWWTVKIKIKNNSQKWYLGIVHCRWFFSLLVTEFPVSVNRQWHCSSNRVRCFSSATWGLV